MGIHLMVNRFAPFAFSLLSKLMTCPLKPTFQFSNPFVFGLNVAQILDMAQILVHEPEQIHSLLVEIGYKYVDG